jgi:hypothetical protein
MERSATPHGPYRLVAGYCRRSELAASPQSGPVQRAAGAILSTSGAFPVTPLLLWMYLIQHYPQEDRDTSPSLDDWGD